jgi:hypothetical protein
MLASEAFPRFLEHPSSIEMIAKLRLRESAGEQLPCRTAAYGVTLSEGYWLDMFKAMSEAVSIGLVVSDMTIPGIPLVHINEGFKAVTGYGKEKIGTSCRFLQGKETEPYLNDEIMGALQQSESLLIKIHNYKANGQKFQCLFALHPVFGPAPETEYKFQIGIQIDYNDQDLDMPRKLIEMGRIIRNLPQSVGGDKLPGVDSTMSEFETLYGPPKAAGGMGGGGGGGFAGGFAAQPPGGPPPSFGGAPRFG